MAIITQLHKTRWWAYLDDQGKVHIKKYISDRQIQNCEQLPFCKGIFEPFEAYGYEDAHRKIAVFLSKEQEDEKRKLR